MIQVGERLPAGTLMEMNEVEAPGCPVGPVSLQVLEQAGGKRIIIFGLPGAFTPTCSARHVPGYVAQYDRLRAKGVDEIWCVSVNDAFVMGAWSKDQNAAGKIRMLADGNADYSGALGLEIDMSARGMGVRSKRYAMLVEDGVVKALNVEQPGKFEVSSAETMLALLG
jgi:glutaredoxin/glutathione-dependent peroxiredoxin